MSSNHEHLIHTGSVQFGLDHLGPVLPALGEIMHSVGTRMWKCYHAAAARNRPLARFQLAEAISLLEKAVFLNPRYADSMEAFVEFEVDRVREAIEAEDWDAFERGFELMVNRANAYHELFDRPFLRWRVPTLPPADLDLTPRD